MNASGRSPIVARSSGARVLAALLALACLASATPTYAQDDPIYSKGLLQVPEGGKDYKVHELVGLIGGALNKIIAIEESIKDKSIHLYNSADLNFFTLVEVFRTYQIELEIKNAGGVDILRAMPVRTMQGFVNPADSPYVKPGEKLPGGQQYVTAVYYFENIDQSAIQQAQTAIRALQARDPRRAGNTVQVPGTNAIILTDFSTSVDFYLNICRTIDQPSPQLEYKIVKVNYALADELAGLVNSLTPALDLDSAQGGGAAAGGGPRRVQAARGGTTGAAPGQPQVVADARTNNLVILALRQDINKIERLVRELDVKVPASPRHFHIYRCVNASAVDLADALNALFGGVATQFGSTSQRTQRTSSRTTGVRTTQGQRNTTTPTTRTQPGRIGGTAAGGTGFSGPQANPGAVQVDTRIVPDEQTNSLLIQAAPEDYREILDLLRNLDKKRRRVLIEAQVWEVEVTDDLFFAVDSAFSDGADSGATEPNAIRGHGLSSFGLLAPVVNENGSALGLSPSVDTFGRGGLVALLTQGTFDRVPVILQALATESKANLLTMPFAITNDGDTAEFSVTQQEPFQTQSQGNVSVFSGFDFATAESRIEITPRIASGSNLTLELNLSIESFTAAPQGNAPPPSSGRNYSGVVTIPNRQYVIFGGLELESETEARSRIPLLGDIPLIGWLFGSTSHRKVRRRIYVFVRPVIFDDTKSKFDFQGDIQASTYLYERVRATSLFGTDVMPVIPDQVMDAKAPGMRATLYGMFGEGGQQLFIEPKKTDKK